MKNEARLVYCKPYKFLFSLLHFDHVPQQDFGFYGVSAVLGIVVASSVMAFEYSVQIVENLGNDIDPILFAVTAGTVVGNFARLGILDEV